MPTFYPLLIDCGVSNSPYPGYVDTLGRTWVTDAGYFSGQNSVYAVGSDIAFTDDDLLYRTERNSDAGLGLGTFTYAFPSIPVGIYNVTLHFAEI
jgi:Malectin domain